MKKIIYKSRDKLVEKIPKQGGMSKAFFAKDFKNNREIVIKFFKRTSEKIRLFGRSCPSVST